MNNLNEIKDYLRSFRVDVIDEKREENGEVFTPLEIVQQMLDQYPKESFTDPDQTWCDISVGNGAFLSEVLIRKLEAGISLKTSLQSLFGIDIDESNIIECRKRLSCQSNDTEIAQILGRNLIVGNSEKYHFRFDGSHPDDVEAKEMQKEQVWNAMFSQN